MRLSLLVFLCFVCGPAQAASPGGLTVRSVEFKATQEGEGPPISMPFVQSTPARVAANINDRLFLARLGVLAPKRPPAVLVDANASAVTGQASQSFSVLRNDRRVLSIDFEIEGCGAYCETYHETYAFDRRTGRLLDPRDLFTPDGMADLRRQLQRARLVQYRQALASLRQERREAIRKGQAGNLDDIKERIHLNRGCIGEGNHTDRSPGDGTLAQVQPGTLGGRFSLLSQDLELTAERCSNHAMRALDDVGDVSLTLPYAQVRSAMTPYGKSVLLNDGSVPPTPSPYGQLLRGRLGGRTAVTLLLESYPDHTVSGTLYFHDPARRAIALRGREEGARIELEAFADEGQPATATLRLTRVGTRLSGQFGEQSIDLPLAP